MEYGKKCAGSLGSRSKLLAAVAVLAVVACALCVVAPTADATDPTDGETEILEVQIGSGTSTTYKYSQLATAIDAINQATEAVTVDVLADFTADLDSAVATHAAIWITSAADVTINGNGKTITAIGESDTKGKNVLGFDGTGSYTVSDLNIDGNSVAHHGINIYGTAGKTNVTLSTVSIQNYCAAGITINKSEVEATGITAKTEVSTAWGGINVDNGGDLSIDTIANVGSVWSEKYLDSTADGTADSCTIEIGSTSSIIAEMTYNSEADSTRWQGFYASVDDMANAYTANSDNVDFEETGASLTVNRSNELTVDLELGSDDTLTVTGNATLTVSSAITGKGKIVGEVKIGNGGSISEDIDDTEMTYDVEYSDFYGRGETTQDISFPQQQRVIVAEGDTWTITNGNTIVINGELIVEGTLVIEEGGRLILGDDYRAYADISGSIIADGGDLIVGYANGTVSGSIEMIEGDMYIGKVGSDGFVIDGTLEISSYATVSTGSDGALTIGESGVVDIYGLIGGTVNLDDETPTTVINARIYNAGTLTIDNGSAEREEGDTTGGDLDVYMTGTGATFNLNSYLMEDSSSRLAVTDEGLVLGTRNNTHTVSAADHNKFGIPGTGILEATVFTGPLVITVGVTGSATAGYTHTMDVSGTIASDSDEAKEILFETKDCSDCKNGIAVTGTLDIGAGISLKNNATLDVSGQMTLTTVTENAYPSFTNNGVVSIDGEDGLIRIIGNAITNNGTINAAYYQTREGVSTTYHNYASFSGAVAGVTAESNLSTTKNVTIMGTVKVVVNVDVPSPVKVSVQNDSEIVIGDTTDSGRDVIVTMANGTEMTTGATASEITVMGSLTYENKKNDKAQDHTVADVIVEDETRDGFRTYTNIYTALEGADDGSTVTVSDSARYVVLDRSVTVPAGVTLYVPADAANLLLRNGVTLTVDGTLTTEEEIFAENEFDVVAANNTTAGQEDLSSTIVVNGTLQSTEYLKYEFSEGGKTIIEDLSGYTGDVNEIDESVFKALSAGSPIAGAYYTTEYDTVISTLEIAVASVADIDDKITVNGTVTAGDITFAAGKGCTEIEVGADLPNKTDVKTVLTVGSLTLDGTMLDVTNGSFNGTVVVDDSRLEVTNITRIVVEDREGMSVSGSKVSGVGTAGAIELSAGNATFSADVDDVSDTVKTTVTVAAGATLVSAGADIDTLVVNGTVDIASSGERKIASEDVTINEGGIIDIAANENADFETLTVYGTFSVAASTTSTSAGNATVDNLYVGITPDDAKVGNEASAGTVSGPVSGIILAYVSPQATVDESVQATLDEKKSTAFDVQDSVWFTIYSDKAITLPADIPVDNVALNGWMDEDGKLVGYKDDTADGVQYNPARNATLYADIEYDIYSVYVLANEAVDDVFIDGQLMQYGMIPVAEGDDVRYYYGYYAVVAAGSHTISYTLANGYSGDGVLFVNGTQQSSLDFTTSDDNGMVYNLQLSGFEKSGYETGSTVTDEEGGLGITDILLIILVVLIVIMAIIVALRMLRS